MSCVLEVVREGSILRLILDDQPTRNSLSEAMIASLAKALEEVRDDVSLKVMVISAKGPVFCSGHNLKELTSHRDDADRGKAYFQKIMNGCSAMMQAIVAFPVPVIAEVQGAATAAGCQLVASCDLAIAADTATFATPGVNIGLFCSTPMVALSRTVSEKHAKEMLFTGEAIDAREALRIGLINRAVPSSDLRGATAALAGRIASKARTTVVTGKEAFNRQRGLPLHEAYAAMSATMTENLLRADACEGISAFIAKRKPAWSS
jgi:enoyl-CoA hydratase/carnithine racemase